MLQRLIVGGNVTELEKLVYNAVEQAINDSITRRIEAETSEVVERLLDEHRIEYSSLMHKAIMASLEKLSNEA